MAKKLRNADRKRMRELPRVQLIPVSELNENVRLKMRETQDLLAKLILLARKRGRPSAEEKEIFDAA